jgi:hypothetical protein
VCNGVQIEYLCISLKEGFGQSERNSLAESYLSA